MSIGTFITPEKCKRYSAVTLSVPSPASSLLRGRHPGHARDVNEGEDGQDVRPAEGGPTQAGDGRLPLLPAIPRLPSQQHVRLPLRHEGATVTRTPSPSFSLSLILRPSPSPTPSSRHGAKGRCIFSNTFNKLYLNANISGSIFSNAYANTG